MIKIVNDQPDASVVKKVICQHCGCTLEYVPMDLQEDYSTDYLGDKDFYKFIRCPKCDNKIIVKRM